MQLESARALKLELLSNVVAPLAARARRRRAGGASPRAGGSGGFESEGVTFGVGARPFETVPRIQRSVALGVAGCDGRDDYRLAIRVQRPALLHSPLVQAMVAKAKGEADVRMIGRLDKRITSRRVPKARRRTHASATAAPWYQGNSRPLLIGSSIGHVGVTAGTLGPS